ERSKYVSSVLYRLRRFVARQPWPIIGGWIVLAIAVIALGTTSGQRLEDSFDAPGLDSTAAVDLLSRAGASNAGLTAQVVAVPRDPAASYTGTSPASNEARSELEALVASLQRLPSAIS